MIAALVAQSMADKRGIFVNSRVVALEGRDAQHMIHQLAAADLRLELASTEARRRTEAF